MKAIVLDFSARTITISSAFEKKALIPGSTEYVRLMEVRHEFPDFLLETCQFKTNTKQDHYKGLTYDFMRWYIAEVEGDNAPSVLEGFEALIRNTKGHSLCKRYPTVKKWFLFRYPEFAELGMTAEQLQKYREARAELLTEVAPADGSAPETGNMTELPGSNLEPAA